MDSAVLTWLVSVSLQGQASSDYSLVALLTADASTPNMEECAHRMTDKENDGAEGRRGSTGGWAEKIEEQPLDGMIERLAEGSGAKLSTVPVRAQAELLARLKPLQLDDGMVIMAKGTQPSSIFFVRSGAVTVSVGFPIPILKQH
jgi:hypothetical protein